jgi:hypothetical protein
VNHATPEMRSIAERLIKYEMQGTDPSETTDTATFPVADRLRLQLATLMGNGGFRALLARALALASAEVFWLREVQVKADGTLDGLAIRHASLEPAEFREGREVLLAHLLGLLVAFIGPALTSRLMGEIWPQLAADDVDPGSGDKNGDEK